MSNVVGIFVKFWHFLRCPLTNYGYVRSKFRKIFVFLILPLILGKGTKFVAEKPSTSTMTLENLLFFQLSHFDDVIKST